MPAVALRGLTVFPHMIIHFDVSRQKSIIAVEQAMMQEQKLFLVAQKDMSVEEPVQEELYTIGTIACVKQVSKLPGGLVRVLVEGINRGKLELMESVSLETCEDEFLQASVSRIEEVVEDNEG
jgi:ATP-dependent Lon protease